jgi:hypothetical protein
MMTISINVALARMERTVDRDGKPAAFTIEFVKSDGSIRKMKAQKHVKYPGSESAKSEKSNLKYNLRKNYSILLYDTEANEYRTVKIDRIIRFNNMEVLH